MAGKRDKPEEIFVKLQTYDRWRRLYGGMGREHLRRLKELEQDRASEGAIGSIPDPTATSLIDPARRRWSSGSGTETGHETILWFVSPSKGQTRVRFGYRRVHVLPKREGRAIDAKETCRGYKELSAGKTPKWRMKAKLRVRPVVESFSRYVPTLDPRVGSRGEDVVATLDRVCKRTGYRAAIEAAGSSRATGTSGPAGEASRSTSRDQESRRTMASSRHSTADSGSGF